MCPLQWYENIFDFRAFLNTEQTTYIKLPRCNLLCFKVHAVICSVYFEHESFSLYSFGCWPASPSEHYFHMSSFILFSLFTLLWLWTHSGAQYTKLPLGGNATKRKRARTGCWWAGSYKQNLVTFINKQGLRWECNSSTATHDMDSVWLNWVLNFPEMVWINGASVLQQQKELKRCRTPTLVITKRTFKF